MLRVIRLSSLLLLTLVVGIWAFAWVSKSPDETLGEAFATRLAGIFGQEMPVPAGAGGMQLPGGMSLGGAFELVNQSNQPVTERDFAGRWLLVYFGFTYCPDVCPTELGTMAAALDVLGPLSESVIPVLITIDPQRDTPDHLADYVSRFHPRMQGLTGSVAQVAAAARAYRVYFARVQRPDVNDYLMDHSSFIYLVGPDAKVRALFRAETSPETLAAAVRSQLRAARIPGA